MTAHNPSFVHDKLEVDPAVKESYDDHFKKFWKWSQENRKSINTFLLVALAAALILGAMEGIEEWKVYKACPGLNSVYEYSKTCISQNGAGDLVYYHLVDEGEGKTLKFFGTHTEEWGYQFP